VKAVILAGGKGTRLRPYTTHFPKPLMPLGDKPIIEIVIKQLKLADIEEIIVTTGHLSEMFHALLNDGKKLGVKIKYSVEDKPMGTAGPLSILRNDLREDFFVVNGDVLCDLNFLKMRDYHLKNGNAATIGVAERSVFVDFGLVHLDNLNCFSEWEEKPTIKYLVSMGIYVLSPDSLNLLPDNEFFNIPDLIQKLHHNKKKVMGFTHRGMWLDIGRPDDYENACNIYETKQDLLNGIFI
jgi:NDP-sugar pyrophosphorylase family protein